MCIRDSLLSDKFGSCNCGKSDGSLCNPMEVASIIIKLPITSVGCSKKKSPSSGENTKNDHIYSKQVIMFSLAHAHQSSEARQRWASKIASLGIGYLTIISLVNCKLSSWGISSTKLIEMYANFKITSNIHMFSTLDLSLVFPNFIFILVGSSSLGKMVVAIDSSNISCSIKGKLG